MSERRYAVLHKRRGYASVNEAKAHLMGCDKPDDYEVVAVNPVPEPEPRYEFKVTARNEADALNAQRLLRQALLVYLSPIVREVTP